MIYDALDRHLPAAGSIERAAVPLGMYLAWCVNLQLVATELLTSAESLVLRVRYREVAGSELLVSACGGVLDAQWLNQAGREFADWYYPRYMDDFRTVFGDGVYDVEDDWEHYDKIAPLLTQRLYEDHGHGGGRRGRRQSKRKSNKEGAWWKFWK